MAIRKSHPPIDLADVLERAADLIDRGGLARNRAAGPGDRLSVEGAIDRAYRDLGAQPAWHGWALTDRARAAVGEVIDHEGSLQSWNDRATDEEAIGSLLLAADAVRARHRARRSELVGAGRRNPHEW